MKISLIVSMFVAVLVSISPLTAQAYMGPGLGITMIGTLVAFLGALLLALVGFVWYPLKRLRAQMKAKREAKEKADQVAPLS